MHDADPWVVRSDDWPQLMTCRTMQPRTDILAHLNILRAVVEGVRCGAHVRRCALVGATAVLLHGVYISMSDRRFSRCFMAVTADRSSTAFEHLRGLS